MRWFGWFRPKSARQVVEEFIEAFPGKCMICSLHRFGRQEGLVSGEVKDHECIDQPRIER